jgi:hypothetical protein
VKQPFHPQKPLKYLTHKPLKQPKKAGDVVARGVDDLVEAFALAALSSQEDQNIAGKQQRGNMFQKQKRESQDGDTRARSNLACTNVELNLLFFQVKAGPIKLLKVLSLPSIALLREQFIGSSTAPPLFRHRLLDY